MTLAIITPSYISSPTRRDFAQQALHSLQQCLGQPYPHIVVDDIPRLKGRVIHRLPNLRARRYALQVYQGEHIELIRRYQRSSVTATLEALRTARKAGHQQVFLHLDDNVYIPVLGDLLRYAEDAFARHPDLQLVRLTGVPILSGRCTPEQGNRTQLQIGDDEIRYESVTWTPQRHEAYTLWKAPFNARSMDGDYWALPLWSAVYRTELLETVLTLTEEIRRQRFLGAIELYWRNHWQEVHSYVQGSFGHINMQFAGLEMQRNKNWQELLRYPNDPIL